MIQPGQITGQDLSPVANILGNQIADKTLTFRNFNESVFKIMDEGDYTTTIPYVTTNPGAGKFAEDDFVVYNQPHGLGFTPQIVGSEETASGIYTPIPYIQYNVSGGGTIALWARWAIGADATNTYIILKTMSYGGSWTNDPGFIFHWYYLQQSANSN